MKKLTLFAVAAFAVLSMTSCKKDRVCTCTTTTNGVAAPAVTTTFIKAKKSEARLRGCIGESGTTNVWDNTTNSYKGVPYSTTCELK